MKRAGYLKALVIDAVFFNSISAPILKNLLRSRRGAVVFVYHLVCDKGYHPFLKSGDLPQVDVDLFRNQLAWLAGNGFSFITIDELADKIMNGEAISPKSIAITFDDGFKVTVESTLPILRSFKIKATFFITTDWIDSSSLLWQQRYYWYLANHGLKDFFDRMKEIDKISFAGLDYPECHYKFMREIPPGEKDALLERYGKPISNEKGIASEIYLRSEDVLMLDSSGMRVGSHSCGHYHMCNLPDNLYLEEMLRSKEKLENLIKKPVEGFSYPFNSYREDGQIVKKAGYKVLCTVGARRVDRRSPLNRMPRFNIPARNILFENSLRKAVYFKG